MLQVHWPNIQWFYSSFDIFENPEACWCSFLSIQKVEGARKKCLTQTRVAGHPELFNNKLYQSHKASNSSNASQSFPSDNNHSWSPDTVSWQRRDEKAVPGVSRVPVPVCEISHWLNRLYKPRPFESSHTPHPKFVSPYNWPGWSMYANTNWLLFGTTTAAG